MASVPRRTDSLAASKAPIFPEIEDEIRDVKRVQSHGQEEDLRMGLSKTISRVEELSSLLKESYKIQTDLQTELTLAKSNLQLALANNEMLEDALKRDPGSSRDVGWRRWGAKEQKERELESAKRRSSTDSTHSIDVVTPSTAAAGIASPTIPASATTSDGRFFRFRFGNNGSNSGTTTPNYPPSPRISGSSIQGVSSPTVNGNFHSSHLTSASLPSLVPEKDSRDVQLEHLAAELEKERKALKTASAAKDALEAELESLSQALFEEANKMVATERMKLAETQEELREAQLEKEALKSALRLVESQYIPHEDEDHTDLPSAISHTRNLSTSSAMAVKSLPSTAPTSPISTYRKSVESDPPSISLSSLPPNTTVLTNLSVSPAVTPAADTVPVAPRKIPDPISIISPKVETPLSSAASLSTEAPPASTTPTPSPGSSSQILYVPKRPIAFLEEAESPWADVRSASTPPGVGV